MIRQHLLQSPRESTFERNCLNFARTNFDKIRVICFSAEYFNVYWNVRYFLVEIQRGIRPKNLWKTKTELTISSSLQRRSSSNDMRFSCFLKYFRLAAWRLNHVYENDFTCGNSASINGWNSSCTEEKERKTNY